MASIEAELKNILSKDHLGRAQILGTASDKISTQDLAEMCGKSIIWVNNYIKLYWFPQRFKDLLIQGRVGMTELIQSVAQYHQADPEKYEKAFKDLQKKMEEKKKKTPAKRGRKKVEGPKLPDLKRYHKVAEWIKSDLEAKPKRSATESRALEIVNLIFEGGKKEEVQLRLAQIMEQTSGRK
jgi:hypothetical protein